MKGKTTVQVTETFERYENGKLVERRQRVRDEGDEPLFETPPMPDVNRFMDEVRSWIDRMPKFGGRQ
jgi:hypothetical protein